MSTRTSKAGDNLTITPPVTSIPPPSASSSSSSIVDSYPFSPIDAAALDASLPFAHPHSASVIVSSLISLCTDLRALAIQDAGRIAGSVELAARMDDLVALLGDHHSLIVAQRAEWRVQRACDGLRQSLIYGKAIMNRALETSFRRGAQFKQPVRILLSDFVLASAKLGHAIALTAAQANAKPGADPSSSPSGVEPALATHFAAVVAGQEECLLGDKSYFGHAVAQDYAAALRHYVVSAGLGYSHAANSAGSMFREGRGTEKDLPKAVEWYKKAAALNNLDAINNLGQMHELGDGVVKDLSISLEFYQQSANGGHLDAATNLGYIYEHGSEDEHNYVPIDLDAAAAWYTEASNAGYAKAQNNLGYLCFIGASSALASGMPDYSAAVKWFERASAQGLAGAQNNLAICLESGRGTSSGSADPERAQAMYAAAAKQGHPSALASLGYIYLKQRSFALALDCLHRAAESDDREALYHLGQMYHHGLHVGRNDATSFMYYLKSSSLLHPYALLEVGHSLFSGRGTLKDTVRAFQYYKQSADLLVAEAENACGIMQEEGVGTMQDVEQAMAWYMRAASRGNSDAVYNIGLCFEQGKGCTKDVSVAKMKMKEAAELGSVQAKVWIEQDKMKSARQA